MAKSKQLKRLKPWHYRLIDWLLANPQATQRECAEHFRKSPIWISLIINSPVFQAELQRRGEVLSLSVAEQMSQRATALAHRSLDQMGDRLAEDGATMPLREIRETCRMALKALGYPVG